MADDINKKISIDVEINTDGQQQINQYKASFDSLRTSINSLDKDLLNFTDSVNKLNTQNKSVSDSGNKVKDTITKLSETSKVLPGFIDLVTASFESLEGALTGGLTVLIAFAPEIIKWVGNLIKGDTNLKTLNQTLRDHKIALEAIKQARVQGNQDAQQELVHLNLLYNASQNHTLSLKDRKKAVAELQSQYPSYFGNMSSELILAGKATNAYKDLSKAIIATAQAKAAEQMMVTNSQRQISDNMKATDLKQQLDQKQKELDAAKAAQKKEQEGSYKHQVMAPGVAMPITDAAADEKVADLQQQLYDIMRDYNNAKNDSTILDTRNKALADYYNKNIQGGANVFTSPTNSGGSGTYSPRGRKSSSSGTRGTSQASSPIQRDTTTLGPASSVGLSQTDEQQPGFVNATIAADDNIAAKPDPAAVAKFEQAKQAAQQLKDFEIQTAQQVSTAAFGIVKNGIKQQADAKIAALEKQKNAELANSNLTGSQKAIIEAKYKKQEDKVKAKAFKEEQEASLAQAVINGALAITKATSQTGVLSAFVIPGIIAETAIQVAAIVAQKPPAYATGGLHYTSDGKGGMLPGYSRTDNTNAYLRSGEGIVVSEAMRDPWARNLVSAINVGFGGRDFSTTATGRGFAVGGIFTDGGDANRYYNAPVNDQKNLANSIAYQMVNNFPPVYVDVKDINNQQNILAQTINRVNL